MSEKRKVLAPNPKSILQWVVRDIIGLSKGKSMKLPLTYDNYIFDLYGTLVDIHTDESDTAIWEKLAMFYGYYGALYETKELKERYETLVKSSEAELKKKLEDMDIEKQNEVSDAQFAISYAHEASPEIHIEDVFEKLYEEKGVNPTKELSVHTGQFFRVMSTEYIKLYPGTKEMLKELKKAGKNVYLLSNAQRIFTAYEMRRLDIFDLFDDVFISSDYNTKKPDIRFYKELINKHDIDVSKSLFIGNDSTTDIKGAKKCRMDAFYVKSNISPKDDMAHDADYIIDNFTNW